MFCFQVKCKFFPFAVVNNAREPIRVAVGEARDHCFCHVYFIKERNVVSLMRSSHSKSRGFVLLLPPLQYISDVDFVEKLTSLLSFLRC